MTEQVQLSLNDFALVVSVIDTVTERGAFKGNELATVGSLRERFVAFVEANRQTDQSAGDADIEAEVEADQPTAEEAE